MGKYLPIDFYYYKLNFSKFSPHALKGQKLLAQGSALGYFDAKPVALSGRVFKIRIKNPV